MPVNPVIPFGGLAGWRFLERTQARQQTAFNASTDIQRDITYFREHIGDVKTSKDLVTDRRLLTVALNAYGLGDEINKQAFVRKVLDGGVFDSNSFANRLQNTGYIDLTKMFSFADGGFFPTSGRINEVIDKYLVNKFETAVGDEDTSMRLSLNFKRQIVSLAQQNISRNTGWLRVLGSVPLRRVLDASLDLPSGFSQINIDQQVEVIAEKANKIFGGDTVKVFADPKMIDKAIRRFQLRQQINNGPGPSTRGSAALALLSGGAGGFASSGLGANGILNLLLSNG